MIYFIDEDAVLVAAYEAFLRLNGFDVTVFPDADQGLHELPQASDIEFVFLDVMLAAGRDYRRSQFSREETEDFSTTGLVLWAKLPPEWKSKYRNRVAFLTNLPRGTPLWERLQRECAKDQVLVLKKESFETGADFLDVVGPLIRPQGKTDVSST